MSKVAKMVILVAVLGLVAWGVAPANAGCVHGKGWAKGRGIAHGTMIGAGQGTASGTGIVIWRDNSGHIHTKRGTGTVSGRGIAIGRGTICGKGVVAGKGWAAGRGHAGHFK